MQVLVALQLLLSLAAAGEPEADSLEFFERRVRPILIERCYQCHGNIAEPKSRLRLDSREGMLTGGKRGPAVIPGSAKDSLLVHAIRRETGGPAPMPPKGALSSEQITDLVAWIDAGALWPTPKSDAQRPMDGQWAFQPLRVSQPPILKDSAWVTSPIDAYLLARMPKEGLSPAPTADKALLLRRATFDLIGLPPTPAEIRAFLADDSPKAFEKVVDRLLASPHYGERWARHWLDVVAFAETDGHEYDFDKSNAYLFRDYVIDAFNADLPYDRFLAEQLAGDLSNPPRLTRDGGAFASSIGAGLPWFGEVQSAPVDPAASKAVEMEHRIDVLGKATLGLTLACARCHDHKFDPISQRDYYALAGIFESSRKVQVCVDAPTRLAEIQRATNRAIDLDRQISALRVKSRVAARRAELKSLPRILLESASEIANSPNDLSAQAKKVGVDEAVYRRWFQFLHGAKEKTDPVFYPWVRLSTQSEGKEFEEAARSLLDQLAAVGQTSQAAPESIVFEDFEKPKYVGWNAIGQAFGSGSASPSAIGPRGVADRRYADSGKSLPPLVGKISSKPFTIQKEYVGLLIAGTKNPGKLCVRLMEDGEPLPKLSAEPAGESRLTQQFIDCRTLVGRRAIIEIVDDDPAGWIAVDQIVFTDVEPTTNKTPNQFLVSKIASRPLRTREELEMAYAEAFDEALQTADAKNHEVSGRFEMAQWLLGEELPWDPKQSFDDFLTPQERSELIRLRAERDTLLKSFPASTIALTTAEGAPHDVAVQVRGNPHETAETAPRGFPALLNKNPKKLKGSGRLELAQWLTSEASPLVARVMVNRLWRHHFGRGIVATTDNFGSLGERPTHPELLDDLARRFMESGWSIKQMHRLMMLSSAYQQSSRSSEAAEKKDPSNRFLSHMPIRRLEAEAIRDSMLAASGLLDATMFGPSIPLHVTSFMEGRDVPVRSGPMDGARRRSIYLEVRRNHRSSLLSAFDLPKAESSAGSRAESIVPSQALAMMNNPLPRELAAAWAARIMKSPGSDEDRIREMFLAALGRPVGSDQTITAKKFLTEQENRHRESGAGDDSRNLAWADLCLAVFQMGEFIYLF